MKPFDQQARDRLAALMRALYSNRITNLEFDERVEEFACADHAAFNVFWLGAWRTYDDFHKQHFTGERALTRDGRRTVARWILFLKSGQPYKWPKEPGMPRWAIWLALASPYPVALYFGRWELFGLGLAGMLWVIALLDGHWSQMNRRKFESTGDFDLWPFFSKTDYEAALKNPPYFRGGRLSQTAT